MFILKQGTNSNTDLKVLELNRFNNLFSGKKKKNKKQKDLAKLFPGKCENFMA